MAARGRTVVEFNDGFFEEIMKSAGVKALTRSAADRVALEARASAPVKTGAYRDGIEVKEQQYSKRTAYLVVGTDKKTLLVESKTGNLAKALKKAKA